MGAAVNFPTPSAMVKHQQNAMMQSWQEMIDQVQHTVVLGLPAHPQHPVLSMWCLRHCQRTALEVECLLCAPRPSHILFQSYTFRSRPSPGSFIASHLNRINTVVHLWDYTYSAGLESRRLLPPDALRSWAAVTDTKPKCFSRTRFPRP